MQRVGDALWKIFRMMHGGNHGDLLAHQALQHALHSGALCRIEAGERFVQQ